MEQKDIYDRVRRIVPAIALSLGAIGVSACAKEELMPAEKEFSESNGNIQNDVSKFIGQLTGVYDEDGNVISRDKSAKNN